MRHRSHDAGMVSISRCRTPLVVDSQRGMRRPSAPADIRRTAALIYATHHTRRLGNIGLDPRQHLVDRQVQLPKLDSACRTTDQTWQWKALRGERKRRGERWSARRRAMIHQLQYAVVYW